jgi:TrmH RNA methyltransferase
MSRTAVARPPSPPPASPPVEESLVCGLRAALAVGQHHPDDIVRAYVSEARLPQLGGLLHAMAARRRAYHVRPEAELDRVAESTHHEGVVLLRRALPRYTEADLPALLAPSGPLLLVWADGIGNPHHLGGLLRTAAFLGATAVIGLDLPRPSAALCRVAEGAAETVPLVNIEDPLAAIRALQRGGVTLLGTDSEGAVDLYAQRLPARVVMALGSESEGLSASLRARCAGVLRVPGSGAVQSLNVGVAAALVMGEWRRQQAGSAG